MKFSQKKWVYAILYLVISGICYFFTNHFQFFPELPLPRLQIDRQIPYLSWTIIIYLSYYPLMVLPMLLCKDEDVFSKMFRGYAWILALSTIFFFFFPTRICRANIPMAKDFFTQYPCRLILSLDTEYNACPSLHVACSLIGAFTYLWHGKYWPGLLFLPWAILVIISTLTIKQHLFIDVVGGITLALIVLIGVNAFSSKPSQF